MGSPKVGRQSEAGAGQGASAGLKEGDPREEEQRLLERLRRGDTRAFDDLVLRYQDRLYNVAYRLLGDHDEAKDMTQEAFVRAYTHLEGFRGEASLASWLFTILRNLSKNKLREWSRRRRGATESLEGSMDEARLDGQRPRELADPGLTALDQLEVREREDLVHRALQAIEPDYRTVVLLYDFEGMSYEDIAKTCECPVGTVRSRLHRGRAMVRIKLGEYVRR